MKRLKDLENIVDTLSVLIKETKSKDLKDYLKEIQQEFYIEKDELEAELDEIIEEREAECRRDLDSIRL